MKQNPKELLKVSARELRLLAGLLSLLLASSAIIGLALGMPPQDAFITGKVTDLGTGAPVPNALVRIDSGPLANETYTNSTGDYEMWLAAGSYNLVIVSDAHLLYFQPFSISSGQTLWMNATLTPAPPRDANIRGFVTDNTTGLPVTSGRVVGVEFIQMYANFSWIDNVTGYYEMKAVSGEYQVFTDSVDGYESWEAFINVSSGETYWLNISLTPLPPANSVVWGYVVDASTILPIENALVTISVDGVNNYTYTNSSGYYSFDVFSGSVSMTVSAPGYAAEYADFWIGENESVRQDFNLTATNAMVYGYVNDSSTGLGIPFAWVSATDMWSSYSNWTMTNATGYYDMYVVASDYWLGASASGYMWNSTSFSVLSNQSIRVDLYLTPLPPQNSTVKGYVNNSSTGAAISGASVSIWNWSLGYWNSTSTNASGYYSMSTPAGELQVYASAAGYYDNMTTVIVADGETAWANLSLSPAPPQTALVQGNVYDAFTGMPIAGAWIWLTDWSTYWNGTSTNATGFYQMYTVSGNLSASVGAAGYSQASANFQIADYEVLILDFYLVPLTARIHVNVTDYLTGMPISGAWVSTWNASGFWTGNTTDMSGQTWLDVIADSLTVRVEAGGYYWTEMQVTTQPNQTLYLDVTLYPILSSSALIRGYVNDSSTLNPIWGARIYASGYAQWSAETYSNATGYYELWVVPAPITILATANQHAPGWATVSLSDGETMWLNFSLAPDTTSPSISNLTVVPDSSISINNPAAINATLVELYLREAGIVVGMYSGSYLDQDNYTILLQYVSELRGGPFPQLPLDMFQTGPDSYEIGALWNATTTGGLLGNASSQEYVGAGFGQFGPSYYYVSFGYYYNSSTATSIQSVAFFDDVTGDLEFILDWANGTMLDISDPTGMFGAMRMVVSVNSSTLQLSGFTSIVGAWWPTTTLRFAPDSLVPSGNYLIFVYANDYGDNFGYNATLVSVDNDPPMADAGLDQTAETPALVQFDGTASSDNVAVTNYTWTFVYGGSNVTLYGANLSFQFAELGTYVVTLTVRDAAGWSSQDTVVIVVQDTTPPVANAGSDQVVDQHTVVQFDGSASTDNSGTISNYTWTFSYGGSNVTLWESTPTFQFDLAGSYLVTLTVKDPLGLTDTDTMWVNVTDIEPPVANAGLDRTVPEGTSVTFDGSASTDNVAVVNWTWTFTDGVAITLYGPTASHVFNNPGVYTVTLTVRDAVGLTDTDTLVITVTDTTPPVANAGADKSVNVGDLVTFDGSASTDNVAVVNWTWTFVVKGTTITLYGSIAKYTFDSPGTYEVTLTVRDAAGNADTGVVTITVKEVTQPSFIDQYGWVIGLLVVLAIVVLLVLLFIRGRRPSPAPPPRDIEPEVPPPKPPGPQQPGGP